ncbi:nucleotidyltransferase family protein [Candidatus Woesearchaeota archaeon]|nr:nucleotidyltransferase family protein [Candidatus Woesearchaeota archaeon]
MKQIVLDEKWLLNILRSVRALDLPDWYLAAGVIRNTVWDVLHGYKKRTKLNDIDLVYFDPKKKGGEKEIEEKLHKLYPKYTFEVVNQAMVHEIYTLKPAVKSACGGIATFVETPTCVGVRLEDDDSLLVCAPYGLEDLFTFHVQKVSLPFISEELFTQRVTKKNWKKILPKLVIF